MQITTLIIAPTFFSAVLYVVLGLLVKRMGPSSSLLSARMYTIVFGTCDFISLVAQAVGGAMASGAANQAGGDTTSGTHIMVGGIAFQLVTMTFFAVLMFDSGRRVRHMELDRDVKLVLVAMAIAFTMIYVRGVYRTAELAQGWAGFLITHEVYFVVLDAVLMVITVFAFLALDPASLLPKGYKGPS